MTSIAHNMARWVAVPAIIGGTALGLAGMANAATSQDPHGPGYDYSPTTTVAPPTITPGWHAHHGPQHATDLENR